MGDRKEWEYEGDMGDGQGLKNNKYSAVSSYFVTDVKTEESEVS